MRMHRHLVFVVLAIAVFASGEVGGYVKKAQKGYARKAQGTKVKAKASEESSAGHLSKDQWINGISGFYEMDRNLQSNDQQNKWYTVKITWTEAKGAFKWQNRAGVTWTLTPLSGSSGSWDETKLAVGNDCPYKNEGHEFANIEWVSSEVQYISVMALYSISTV